jgi:hypothetical protein
MSELQSLLNLSKELIQIAGIAISFLGLLAIFYWQYFPAIRLVWRCQLNENNHFPLLGTMKACWDSKWPFKPSIFEKQMRLWLELRLFCPKPVKKPSWKFDPKKGCYDLVKDPYYQKNLDDWKQVIRSKFGVLKIKENEPVIEVKDAFRINNKIVKEGIKRYLLEVSNSIDKKAVLLCKVKINEGYLLPLDLLAGLMSHFDEDWDPIIASYSQMAARSLSPLQMAIFDLWLLWGPSVPVCCCDQWTGAITLQYGFGDENNSIRVRFEDKNLLAELRKSVELRTTTAYPALHVSITGQLWPPSSFSNLEFCSAQHELFNPDREDFILNYNSHTVIGNPIGSHLFYTAYVWALFVVGRETKPVFDEIRKDPWLKIIPFFEHANIVDESTYEWAKMQLAHKVLTFVKNSDRFELDPSAAPLKLWYVCALDDSGCGHNIEVKPKGVAIRTVIEGLIENDTFKDLKQRIVTDDSSFSEVLSGCHLSEMISDFFKDIENRYDNG